MIFLILMTILINSDDLMTRAREEAINVAEAKKQLSNLLGRVDFGSRRRGATPRRSPGRPWSASVATDCPRDSEPRRHSSLGRGGGRPCRRPARHARSSRGADRNRRRLDRRNGSRAWPKGGDPEFETLSTNPGPHIRVVVELTRHHAAETTESKARTELSSPRSPSTARRAETLLRT